MNLVWVSDVRGGPQPNKAVPADVCHRGQSKEILFWRLQLGLRVNRWRWQPPLNAGLEAPRDAP